MREAVFARSRVLLRLALLARDGELTRRVSHGNKWKKKIWQKLTVLVYKCPSFSFLVEIAPCCYTLDIGNKRDHLNVHVSVTKYIKNMCWVSLSILITGKVKFYATSLISHLLQKNWIAMVMPKFITSFLRLAYHTILTPPPPLIAGTLNN